MLSRHGMRLAPSHHDHGHKTDTGAAGDHGGAGDSVDRARRLLAPRVRAPRMIDVARRTLRRRLPFARFTRDARTTTSTATGRNGDDNTGAGAGTSADADPGGAGGAGSANDAWLRRRRAAHAFGPRAIGAPLSEAQRARADRVRAPKTIAVVCVCVCVCVCFRVRSCAWGVVAACRV